MVEQRNKNALCRPCVFMYKKIHLFQTASIFTILYINFYNHIYVVKNNVFHTSKNQIVNEFLLSFCISVAMNLFRSCYIESKLANWLVYCYCARKRRKTLQASNLLFFESLTFKRIFKLLLLSVLYITDAEFSRKKIFLNIL